ncbi:MAG TPA: hypothetical protein VGG85_01585 [Terracidiphilus sp.]
MKARSLLLLVSFAYVPALCSFGQINCDTSTKLVCEFPVSAETLSAQTFGSGAKAAALSTAVPINAAIAAQLTQLPFPSATVGVVSLKRKGSDIPAPFNNLGPVLTDRPDTVGKGHLFAGFSYQHFNFNSLDGLSLNSLPIAFSYTGKLTTPQGVSDQQTYYGYMTNRVKFQLDQYVSIATFGLTRTSDLSVIVPVNSISLSVTSSNFTAYTYDSLTGAYTPGGPAKGTTVSTTGSATGIGDVTLIVKQMVIGQDHNRPAAALGATVRFPSGDALNYLGSGATGGSIFALAEYRARMAPHAKISYQWNNSTKVLNLQQASNANLPGGLQYAVGTDFRLHRKLTMAADILGSQFVNTPYFTNNSLTFNPTPAANSNVPSTYNLVTTPNNTYTTVNFSGGMKWSPLAHCVLYGNALLQLNNVGLRSDVVPLFGIAYNFAKRTD